MPVTILTENLHDELFKRLEQSKEEIRIVSPFLSNEIVEDLCEIVVKNNLKCSFVTRFKCSDLASGVNSLDAMQRMLDAGIKVYGENKLHTKLYISDMETAFIGSANFTETGLGSKKKGEIEGNYEMMLLLQDAPESISQLISYADQWRNSKYEITKKMIAEYRTRIEAYRENLKKNLPKPPKDPSLHRPKATQPKLSNSQTPTVWLKVVGISDDLKKRTDESKQRWPEDYIGPPEDYMIGFSKGNGFPRAQKGDIIYIALLTVNKKGKPDRFIVGKGISKGVDRNQPKKEKFAQQLKDLQERWPIYLELEKLQRLTADMCPPDGIPLSDVWLYSGQHPSWHTPRGGWKRLSPKAVEYLVQRDNMFETIEDE